MRRRDFISLLGGAAGAWSVAARAEQSDRKRRVGVLMGIAETDPLSPARIGVFKQRLQQLGWIEGRNLLLNFLWAAGDADRTNALAKEIVGLQPDVIVAHTALPALALQKETNTIPIVFAVVSNPEGAGLVKGLTNPGRNITGFTNMEPTMGAKWLQMLKEIAPRVKRVAIMFSPDASPIVVPFSRASEAAAQAIAVEVVTLPVHQPVEIEEALTKLGHEPGWGLMLLPDIFATSHRKLILELTAHHGLPAIYPYRYFVAEGGLISYGTDSVDQFAQTSTYVDRILRGAKPGELPVQAPTKFELVINLKTAKALGLTVPDKLLVAADEVIE
jgi:putative tryptophan/tyrosine transport system substrate-binding protein